MISNIKLRSSLNRNLTCQIKIPSAIALLFLCFCFEHVHFDLSSPSLSWPHAFWHSPVCPAQLSPALWRRWRTRRVLLAARTEPRGTPQTPDLDLSNRGNTQCKNCLSLLPQTCWSRQCYACSPVLTQVLLPPWGLCMCSDSEVSQIHSSGASSI